MHTSRYGVLTGRYAWRTSLKSGVLGGCSAPLIEAGRVTVGSLLQRRGYRTAAIGKWHLGMTFATTDGQPLDDRKAQRHSGVPANVDWQAPIRNGPRTAGFDYYFGCAASWDMPPYAWIENDRLVEPKLVPASKEDGFGRVGVKAPGLKPEDALPVLAQKAVEYIEAAGSRPRPEPFFLYFPLTSPHTPIAPRKSFQGRSRAGAYGDFVMETDWVVGRVMDALERTGLAGHTLLIVTSDNGPENIIDRNRTEYGHLSASTFLGRKRDNWEGGHRVPFIARWPGRVPAGVASSELVCLTDLLATCAAITGVELSAADGPDSCNLLPVLLGRKLAAPVRDAVVHHSGLGEFALREGRWKLLLHPGSGGTTYRARPEYAAYYRHPIQLYDLEADPGETRNLAPARPEVVARLTARLRRYVLEGRSRPGVTQANDPPNDWKQLAWMEQ